MSIAIKENIPLAFYTTLRVGGSAEYFFEAQTIVEMREAVSWAKAKNIPVTILGGGSNVLVDDAGIRGLVLRVLFLDVTYMEKNPVTLVTAGAGVVFDTLVEDLVERGLWGLENLSAIPGSVGAAPIQNVGAYGVEIKDVVYSVTVYDIDTDTIQEMSPTECAFEYRDSIFKKNPKKYTVLAVTFSVTKTSSLRLEYKDLRDFFKDNPTPSIRDIRNAIVQIRSKKFPDWNIVGTAGSFFKNPIITQSEYERIRALYPDIPAYTHEHMMMKISLGWVLDRVCGMRGLMEGNVGLYKEQALVLICTREATAHEVKIFAEKVIQEVNKKIGIRVEPEVAFLS